MNSLHKFGYSVQNNVMIFQWFMTSHFPTLVKLFCLSSAELCEMLIL